MCQLHVLSPQDFPPPFHMARLVWRVRKSLSASVSGTRLLNPAVSSAHSVPRQTPLQSDLCKRRETPLNDLSKHSDKLN